MDGRVRPVVGREQRQGLLRSLAVREVAERLPVAELLAALLAVRDRRVVGLELDARARRARRGRDERCDLGDLPRRELAAERRHPVPARPYLVLDGGLVRLQLIEVGSDLTLRAGRLQGVAGTAPRACEDLAARARRPPAGAAGAGYERGEGKRGVRFLPHPE